MAEPATAAAPRTPRRALVFSGGGGAGRGAGAAASLGAATRSTKIGAGVSSGVVLLHDPTNAIANSGR